MGGSFFKYHFLAVLVIMAHFEAKFVLLIAVSVINVLIKYRVDSNSNCSTGYFI